MKRSSCLVAVVLAGSMFTAACGDDDDGPITIEDVCSVDGGLFVEFFNAALACEPELELFFGSFPTDAEIEAACRGQFDPYTSDGTITISQDAEAWAACRTFIEGIDCETFDIDGPNGCEGVFIGSQAEGDDCDTGEQCAGDSFCDDPGTTGGSGVCGTCKPLLADGVTCMDGQECENGLCDSSNVCATRGAAGAACTDDDECLGRLVCGSGNTCETEQVWAKDDACDPMDFGSACGFPASDLRCDFMASTCQPYTALGATCGQGAGFCDFKKFEHCENDGANAGDTCIAGTTVGDGAACGMIDGLECEAGLECDSPFQDGTCGAPLQQGDACVNDGCGNNLFLECAESTTTCEYTDYTAMCPAPPAA